MSTSLPDTVGVSASSDINTEPAAKDASGADDVRSAIVRQVEFYFSDANLPTDKFLLEQVQQGQGLVPVKLIAQFKRVKSLTKDVDLITEALKGSSDLVVSADNMYVRRVKPLPNVNEHDIKRRTVIVTHLPGVPSIESVTDLFSRYGPVKLVRICPPGSTEKLPQWLTVANPCVQTAATSNQLFALVEFETEDAVGKAVADSKGTPDGHNGIQVRHLLFGPQQQRGPQQQQQQQSNRGGNTRRGQGSQGTQGSQGHGRGSYQAGPSGPGAGGVEQLRQDVARMHLQTAPNPALPYHHPEQQQQLRSSAANPARGGGASQDHRRTTTSQRQAPYTHGAHNIRALQTVEAVPYVPSQQLDGQRPRPSSATPAQRILLVRPRTDAPAGGGGGGYERAGGDAQQRGGELGGGRVRDRPVPERPAPDRNAPDRQAFDRPISVGRRAPRFVVDLDYQPTESGRRATSRRQRGRGPLETTFETGPQNSPVTPASAGGSAPGSGSAPFVADKKQQQHHQHHYQQQHQQQHQAQHQAQHHQQQRAKSGRQGGSAPTQNGRQGGSAPLQQAAPNPLFTSPAAVGRGGPLLEAASKMQGLQTGGGGEKDLSHFIALFQSFVEHQLGTPEPAPRPGSSAPLSPMPAPDMQQANSGGVSSIQGRGSAPTPGAASGPTPANTPTVTPAKHSKKAKSKGARGADGRDVAPSTPDHSSVGTPPGKGLFVFGQEATPADAHTTTPVSKTASHGKKGKGPVGGSSQKKKEGPHGGGANPENGAVGGTDGNPGNPEEGAFIPKKRTKKDYAAWAAATADYRAQSTAAYGNGEGGVAASTPPQGGGSHMKEAAAGAPRVPDGTRGFGMGRGRPLPPPTM